MYYFSISSKQLVHVNDMSVRHIRRAIAKIEEGKHPMYHTTGQKVKELRTYLIDRYEAEVDTLKRVISDQQDELHKVRTAQAKSTSRHVPGHTLADLRDLALDLCHKLGTVTADTLRKALADRNQHVPSHALAYVFADPRFKKVGFLRSTTPSNKGRFICVWASSAAV